MEKTIEIDGAEVGYALRFSKRARGVRLSVASGGVFTVTAPPWMRQSRIEEFVLKKSRWVLQKIAYFRQFPKKVLSKSSKRHFAEHKAKALALVQARLKHFSQFYPHTKQLFGVGVYQFRWTGLTIRNQKSRWGSCSRKGNLSFNYKLAFLPPHLADYIIVHELCHLRELNHSARFWELVARTLPNHRTLRRELRKAGMGLP